MSHSANGKHTLNTFRNEKEKTFPVLQLGQLSFLPKKGSLPELVLPNVGLVTYMMKTKDCAKPNLQMIF